MSLIKKYLEEKARMDVDELDTDDYKLDKNGKKHKAGKIVFKKGEDDGKQIGEELKGNQHKLDKNKNGKLDKHDFKLLRKEDAEQVDEGFFDSLKKGYEKGLKTGLKQKIKPEHHDSYNIDSVKSTSDATSILQKAKQAGHTHMKEEAEQVDEAESHQSKTTMKHISNPTAGEKKAAKDIKPGIKGVADRLAMLKSAQARGALKKEEAESHQSKTTMKHVGNATAGEKKAAKDIKPGIAGYRDRVAMLKSAQARGALKKEEAEQVDEGFFDSLKKGYEKGLKTGLKQKIKPEHHDSYNIDSVKSTSDATSILQKAKQAGHTHMKEEAELDESSESWYKDQEAKAEREARAAVGSKNSATVDKIRAMMAKEKADKMKKTNESVFDWKNTPKQTKDKNTTSTYHDVKKISTGTVYTKQFDKDGTSKGTGDDAAKKAVGAEKRGRGRPKKDKFAEAVEFLMDLTEEQFDDMMEEGFDSFVESFFEEGYEGKGNHKPGWMLKADPNLKKKIEASKAKSKAKIASGNK